MAILYACMINRHKVLVFESFYAQNKVTYKREVYREYDNFEYMQIRQVVLNYEA